MNENITIIRICEVLWVDDNTDSNRIKVRLLSDDVDKSIEELPYAIPFLPQMIHIKPKLHEGVLVMNSVANNGNSQRYYIGPVISQINHMHKELVDDAMSIYDTSTNPKDPAPTLDKNKTKGAVPENDEIAVVGRKFSDIVLSDNDLRIRCGVKKVDSQDEHSFSFNATDSAYLKLKYYENGLPGVDKCNSTATIVADKINLIGNQSKDHGFQCNDNSESINDINMKRLIETAHELPYGDKLIEFLQLFRTVFMEHTHPFPMMPPCSPTNFQNLGNYDLVAILSDSVRIN